MIMCLGCTNRECWHQDWRRGIGLDEIGALYQALGLDFVDHPVRHLAARGPVTLGTIAINDRHVVLPQHDMNVILHACCVRWISSVAPALLQFYRLPAFNEEGGIFGRLEIIGSIEDEEVGIIAHFLPRFASICSIIMSAPRISAS